MYPLGYASSYTSNNYKRVISGFPTGHFNKKIKIKINNKNKNKNKNKEKRKRKRKRKSKN